MADALANGWGTVTGTRASPVDLISSATIAGGLNFATIVNNHSSNWLFAKSADVPGTLYQIALPLQSLIIARGPQSTNNIKRIIGFATTANEAGAGTLTATVTAYKIA